MRDWKLKDRAVREAQCLATQDREPYGIVQDGPRILTRPLRKALAICNSPRHQGAVLLEEVEPR